jgi:dienelactone hydrolase
MCRHFWFLVAALAMQLAFSSSARAGMQTVHFKATSEDEFTQTKKVKLSAWLMKPEGAGPFPAIVLLHGCEPWSKQRFHQWGDLFVTWGYVVLAPDSLTPRGLKEVCPKYSAAQKFRQKRNYAYRKLAPRAGPNLRVYDMLDAVRFLAKLSYVNPKKLHIAGWGHGGETAIRGAYPIKWEDVSPKPVAIIAFYPVCGGELAYLSTPIAPVLVLAGEKDEVVRLGSCKNTMRAVTSQSPKSKLVVYPGVVRSFDEPGANYKKNFYRGKYNEPAHQDAIKQVRAFLSSAK